MKEQRIVRRALLSVFVAVMVAFSLFGMLFTQRDAFAADGEDGGGGETVTGKALRLRLTR